MSLASDILDDSGFKSRKYIALFVYWALIGGGYLASARWPSIGANFPSFWAGLSAGLVAYYGVNAGHAYISTKAPPDAKSDS